MFNRVETLAAFCEFLDLYEQRIEEPPKEIPLVLATGKVVSVEVGDIRELDIPANVILLRPALKMA
jgi:hypothetical protein